MFLHAIIKNMATERKVARRPHELRSDDVFYVPVHITARLPRCELGAEALDKVLVLFLFFFRVPQEVKVDHRKHFIFGRHAIHGKGMPELDNDRGV